ncbi:MAG: Bax inhibitor-1/YccA family protein [Candidatus Dadabacteria bacterium]|nr:MAG: Bax inhibitor-1/YccA family protein [Candidatus Dadabacteria bacterium]
MLRTANPALNNNSFKTAAATVSGEVMTLSGAVNKTMISTLITMAAGYWSYSNPWLGKFYLPCIIGALVVALIISFKRSWAPLLTPVYAIAEGVALGTLSLVADTMYPGIAFQAISLTFGVLFALLFAYQSGWIKPSENFKLGIVAATGGIFVVYLLSFILGLFGMPLNFLHDSSPLSIGISIIVVVIAALNLVLDFDFIENAAQSGNVPKYMEWYAAFGLLVTLVWLYVEILRLLMKLNERSR